MENTDKKCPCPKRERDVQRVAYSRSDAALCIEARVDSRLLAHEIQRREKAGAFFDGLMIGLSFAFIIYWMLPMFRGDAKI